MQKGPFGLLGLFWAFRIVFVSIVFKKQESPRSPMFVSIGGGNHNHVIRFFVCLRMADSIIIESLAQISWPPCKPLNFEL